tara:strand:+ start:365 stop:625 length:261 start_codon:yes stop_codon:yes gene_type:complete
MGRFDKVLVNDNGIDKRDSGYYSTPYFVSDYISNELLELNPNGKKVLDPAVGELALLIRGGRKVICAIALFTFVRLVFQLVGNGFV